MSLDVCASKARALIFSVSAPMRRLPLLALGLALFVVAPVARVYAQSGESQDDQKRKAEAEEDAKKKQKDKEWNLTQAPLPSPKSAGPCPFVKALYDASRYLELKDGKEVAEAVGYTGEIEGVQSTCAYKGDEPIKVSLAIKFAFGRGPTAEGLKKDYRYWVAVTVRNAAVLDKEYFDVPAVFEKDQDRVVYVDRIADVVIPRGKATVNGANFEVLVGFDVTPQMAEFNRDGKRFRVNAGAAETQTASNGGSSGTK
jgi:hypothetical protein